MTLNIYYERKVKLALYKLSGYTSHWWVRESKDKIRSWPRMKKMLAINFYPLDYDELLLYKKQDYYWPRSSHLNYFKETCIPPLREELHVGENTFIEEYVEFKEENIEIF